MREKYGANERSQKLKYHVQTSGRSLHAQEMDFNDIRTTLQALIAIYDNANSLHTNAYDEAVTTPTEESVRRALAIQLIINREWGLAMNENPLQGSFVIDELTDLVEAAVLREFDRINERGGVLGAMETGYQRGRIQDESMLYEHRKHDGSLPIIGVNTFLRPDVRRRRRRRSSSPAPPRRRRSRSSRGSAPSRPRTATRPRPRSRGSRRPRSPARTSSPSSWTPPGSARSSRSPRRSSRWAGSTAATSEGWGPLPSASPDIRGNWSLTPETSHWKLQFPRLPGDRDQARSDPAHHGMNSQRPDTRSASVAHRDVPDAPASSRRSAAR